MVDNEVWDRKRREDTIQTASGKRRNVTSSLCEFGECVQYRPGGITPARRKLQSMLQSGVYLGRAHSSAENLTGTPDGVAKARDIYRRPADERFNLEVFKTVVSTPWECTPTRGVETDDIPEFEVLPPEMRRSGEHADGVGEAIPRRVKLTEITERFGYVHASMSGLHQFAAKSTSSSTHRAVPTTC